MLHAMQDNVSSSHGLASDRDAFDIRPLTNKNQEEVYGESTATNLYTPRGITNINVDHANAREANQAQSVPEKVSFIANNSKVKKRAGGAQPREKREVHPTSEINIEIPMDHFSSQRSHSTLHRGAKNISMLDGDSEPPGLSLSTSNQALLKPADSRNPRLKKRAPTQVTEPSHFVLE